MLGEHDINISRMQIGDGEDLSLGVWNLAHPLTDAAYDQVNALPGIGRVCSVR